MKNNINPYGMLEIKQGGCYYNVSGNDALILNKYLGYKLYGINQYRTGFPVIGEKTVLKKIDTLGMDYDLIDQKGNVLVSKRFEDNRYEIIDSENPKFVLGETPNTTFMKRIGNYIDILQGLSEGVNIFTGVVIEGLDEELKLNLFEMAMYFDDRLKAKEELEEKYPNSGKPWTEEEDNQLLELYIQGKSVKYLSLAFLRSEGAIRSRLIKFVINNL